MKNIFFFSSLIASISSSSLDWTLQAIYNHPSSPTQNYAMPLGIPSQRSVVFRRDAPLYPVQPLQAQPHSKLISFTPSAGHISSQVHHPNSIDTTHQTSSTFCSSSHSKTPYDSEKVVSLKVASTALSVSPFKVGIFSHSALVAETESNGKYLIEGMGTNGGEVCVTPIKKVQQLSAPSTHRVVRFNGSDKKHTVQALGRNTREGTTVGDVTATMNKSIQGQYSIIKNNCHHAQEKARHVHTVSTPVPKQRRVIRY